MRKYIAIFCSLACIVGSAGAQSFADLPHYKAQEAAFEGDWLVEAAPQKAMLYQTQEGRALVLSNGLISRTIRITPNAGTIALDQLTSGAALLRGVKPEARVVLDGVSYDVGGLLGQPNYAFLKPEWVESLVTDPKALQYSGFSVGPIEAHVAWDQCRPAAPGSQWPPAGISLQLDFTMPELAVEDLSDTPRPSEEGRRAIIDDDFGRLSEEWRSHVSRSHPRASFCNEGKVGEIYGLQNTAVYVERAVGSEVYLVEATMDMGTDRSMSWGPGLALVYGKRVIKMNLRPGNAKSEKQIVCVGVFDGEKEIAPLALKQSADPGQALSLRLRRAGKLVYCEAKPASGAWETCAVVTVDASWGDPEKVRLGKLSLNGGRMDHRDKGELCRLRIHDFRAWTDLDAAAHKVLAARLKALEAVKVSVHYNLYDGIPLFSKWITVHNGGEKPVMLDGFQSEILAAVEYGSHVEDRGLVFAVPNILVETDYAFGGMTASNTSRFSVHWEPDPDYSSQVNYMRKTPCLLEVGPKLGPAVSIAPGESFESFRTYVLPYDSYDRERKGLSQRRMYRTIAPWVTENPLMMHVRYADWESVKRAIDQCAAVGFEMVILTFGSGFNIEDDSEKYLAEMARYAAYAKEKGVEIGGYSLLASRRIDAENDVVMAPGERPTFGNSPCLLSAWGEDYFQKLYQFYEKTGFALLEHDGSYPGDSCRSETHPGHQGYADSRWKQWRKITDFYKWCRGRGIYLNVPDYYYLSGSNKCGMGYREVNWSLPREQQVIHTRQNIYDGAWEKTPSMGWMFVPLTEYHGGGAAATIEPLDEHLAHYEAMLVSNLALGVQACYRGPRLYDTDRTQAMVSKWVAWYKEYRDILESDMVHGRRADGRSIDWMLHVNPTLKHKGLLAVFNSGQERVRRPLKVDVYYTGLTESLLLREAGGDGVRLSIGRDNTIQVPLSLEAQGFSWFVLEE